VIHGGKAKIDRIDAAKIARLLRARSITRIFPSTRCPVNTVPPFFVAGFLIRRTLHPTRLMTNSDTTATAGAPGGLGTIGPGRWGAGGVSKPSSSVLSCRVALRLVPPPALRVGDRPTCLFTEAVSR
jgi:hypothetical protein